MAEEGVERRLTTILALDVVGYSRLMAADEAGTLTSLKELRRELFEMKAAQYHGRTIKLMGDGTLMEFLSVVEAVTFAVEVQAAMAEHNAGVREDRQILYRVGINISDIIVDGDDIYGNGVNIAARLEAMAPPGGICVSREVYYQVKGKLDLRAEDLGECQVKNIADPVHAFAIRPLKSTGSTTVAGPKMALASADKPSVAVLPFRTMSDDVEQEHYADSLTEDIITDLSRSRELFVVASDSSSSYKDKALKVQDIAQDLGVQYVVEGSLRWEAEHLRITVKLIDAESGGHLWAERYDRELNDLILLEDKIVETVTQTLLEHLKAANLAKRLKARESQKHLKTSPKSLKILLGQRDLKEIRNEVEISERHRLRETQSESTEDDLGDDWELAKGASGAAMILFSAQFIPAPPPTTKYTLKDTWARGYIWGVLNKSFQHYCMNHESKSWTLAAIESIKSVVKLELKEAEAYYMECVALQGDLEFEAGVRCGFHEMSRLLEGHPIGILGLGQYLHDGTKTKVDVG